MTIQGEGPGGRLLTEEVVTINGNERFFGDLFERCHMKLEPGARPTFLLCVLVGCTFDPPFVVDDLESWRFLRANGCQVILDAPAPEIIWPEIVGG